MDSTSPLFNIHQNRILIVDDDRMGTDVRAEFLRMKGFHPEIAYSATQALAKELVQEFAAIIVDYDMPDMNGLQLVIHLRQRGCCAPIIMLSGRVGSPHEPGAELLAGFISKGESPEALLSLLYEITQKGFQASDAAATY